MKNLIVIAIFVISLFVISCGENKDLKMTSSENETVLKKAEEIINLYNDGDFEGINKHFYLYDETQRDSLNDLMDLQKVIEYLGSIESFNVTNEITWNNFYNNFDYITISYDTIRRTYAELKKYPNETVIFQTKFSKLGTGVIVLVFETKTNNSLVNYIFIRLDDAEKSAEMAKYFEQNLKSDCSVLFLRN